MVNCDYCNGTGAIYKPLHNIPKDHWGWCSTIPCICTIKKENKMLKDIHMGSTVIYLDDDGKYPCIKQGHVAAICGTHYIVNDQRLHHNQLFALDNKLANKALYQAAKVRINTLQALANQLGRYIADESIQQN